jgi:predicted Zn-dependent protease
VTLVNLPVAESILSQDQALSLVEEALEHSKAEGSFVSISAGEESLARYSSNQITQNLSRTRFTLTVTSYFGTRRASASTTDASPEAIQAVVRSAEALARIAPEDPEWVPLLEPQTYEERTPAFDEQTANLSPLERGGIIQRVCALSTSAGVDGSGTLSTEAYVRAIGNSQGLRAYNRHTEADFGFTARIEDGSSWSQRTAWALDQLPIEKLTTQIIERSLQSRKPREISPGSYPVVFDGAAFADLLSWLSWNLDARAADEGRSFMSRTDESGNPAGNRLGEAMFSSLLQVQRNPAHPLLQGSTFFGDGLPNRALAIVQDGIPKTLSYSRYWAQKQGKEPTGSLSPVVVHGTNQPLTDLIAQTERGILVSRAWYVRYVNPKTLVLTGMTRDGTFWIENGKVAYPIKNLRFNQSLPDMLRDVDALSTVERYGNSIVPGVRVKAFNFSSVTDSV